MTSGIEPLEVDPIVGILQGMTLRVSEYICPLVETLMDDIRSIPHGFKLFFLNIIIGLVVDKD